MGCRGRLSFIPLQEPGLINDEDAVFIAQMLHEIGAQIITHRVGTQSVVVDRRCIRSGTARPARSDKVQEPFRSAPESSPSRYTTALPRGSERAKRGPISSPISSKPLAHACTHATQTSSPIPNRQHAPAQNHPKHAEGDEINATLVLSPHHWADLLAPFHLID